MTRTPLSFVVAVSVALLVFVVCGGGGKKKAASTTSTSVVGDFCTLALVRRAHPAGACPGHRRRQRQPHGVPGTLSVTISGLPTARSASWPRPRPYRDQGRHELHGVGVRFLREGARGGAIRPRQGRDPGPPAPERHPVSGGLEAGERLRRGHVRFDHHHDRGSHHDDPRDHDHAASDDHVSADDDDHGSADDDDPLPPTTTITEPPTTTTAPPTTVPPTTSTTFCDEPDPLDC